jgi:hypothetical protein
MNIPEKQKDPQLLYKYYRFNKYTEGILTANEIYFPSPNEFNDPFDSRIRRVFGGTRYQKKLFLRNMLPRINPNVPRRAVNEMIRNERKKGIVQASLDKTENRHRSKIGVYCMSEKRDNILMWAHYAECHTGFCLEFDTQNNFFGKALEVKYSEKLPIINIIEYENMNHSQFADILLTKAKDWEYEREWRIVNHWEGPGVKRFPPAALTGVIMGCRISDKHRTFLTTLIKQREPRPQMYEARIKKEEFGLEIVNID